MKKSWMFIASIVVLLPAGIMAVLFFGVNRRSYELHLPAPEKLASISVKKEGRQTEIVDSEIIEDIIYVLSGSGNGRRTKEESISDAPQGAEELFLVDFHFAEQGTSTLFVYKKGGRYYMEQPYNGIYQISGDEYNTVGKHLDK